LTDEERRRLDEFVGFIELKLTDSTLLKRSVPVFISDGLFIAAKAAMEEEWGNLEIRVLREWIYTKVRNTGIGTVPLLGTIRVLREWIYTKVRHTGISTVPSL
jgi:hypothetical protein